MSERAAAWQAVAIALRVHDEALAMNRAHGFEMFDVSAMPEAFITALEAQDPSFTVQAATPEPGIDVELLTTVLYDWMPDGADVSDPDHDGGGLHLTGGDLARFILDRAAEYDPS